SNEEDMRRVHRLRAEADAILVGVGTVLMDDPKLTVKAEYAKGRNPLRVVLDSKGKTPERAHVLDGTAPTLIVTSEDSSRTFPRAAVLRCGKDEVDLVLGASGRIEWAGESAGGSHARESGPLSPVHGIRHRLSGAGSGSGPDRAGSIGRPDPPDTGQGAGGPRLRRGPDSVR